MSLNFMVRLAFVSLCIFLMSACQYVTHEQTVNDEEPAVKDSSKAGRDPLVTLSEDTGKSLIDSIHWSMGYDSTWVAMPEVLPGSILPHHRIIAFYGNLFSKRMGILGELPAEQMMAKLHVEMARWQTADPALEVMPALHVVATTAQRSPGRDHMYRLRQSRDMVHKVKRMADSINALTFLDLQIGHSNIKPEMDHWDSLLSLPTVHLGIDAEFAMYNKRVPGTVMGRFDAIDVNAAIDFLEEKVKQYNLPPKILIVHRFKKLMISNADKIRKTPHVQVVMHMDGWGAKELKFHSYRAYIQAEPVQYTGFKLFYKNDTKYGKKLLTPEEVLSLTPQPVYIQYQ